MKWAMRGNDVTYVVTNSSAAADVMSMLYEQDDAHSVAVRDGLRCTWPNGGTFRVRAGMHAREYRAEIERGALVFLDHAVVGEM